VLDEAPSALDQKDPGQDDGIDERGAAQRHPDHRRFTLATKIDVYFCDTQSPWQRGSSENTNGLLRQYFPKDSDMSMRSQAYLNKVARQLNERPCETLQLETQQKDLTPVLRRPADPAGLNRTPRGHCGIDANDPNAKCRQALKLGSIKATKLRASSSKCVISLGGTILPQDSNRCQSLRECVEPSSTHLFDVLLQLRRGRE
jgi:hypothetical protein